MTGELTNLEKIRSLRWIAASNVMNAVFCYLTVFGAVFILFLSELGFDKSRIGFVVSLLPFCGLLALLAARVVRRIGYKRAFLIFWTARKIILMPILFTPSILERWGTDAAFAWVAVILVLFGICRAFGDTANYPWNQEIIPSYIRGRFDAIASILGRIASILTMLAASYVISLSDDLNRFKILIAAGIVFGFAGIAFRFWVPGGTTETTEKTEHPNFRALFQTLRDKNYVLFLAGLGMAVVACGGLASFVPLFLKEEIGLTSGTVVAVGIGTSVGMLLSCYLWGWAADRYGSKPVMLSGLYLLLLMPFCYFFMPRDSTWSFYFAIGVAFLGGLGTMGWGLAYSRYLFVSAVPMEKRSSYLTIFYAILGLVGGSGPLLAGFLISASSSINSKLLVFTLDGYTPLFAASACLLIVSLVLISRVHSDGAVPLGKFAGMFFQGNTLMAFGSLIRHRLIGDETDRAYNTELMGVARNPLTAVELIELLNDPSFNVRYQAILSSSRIPSDTDLIRALVEILESNEPDLSIAAAWALGNIGDKTAVSPLRQAARSHYALLQARAVRALAALNDVEEIPYFIERLRNETDEGLRIAYGSALGKLRCKEVLGDMVELLRNAEGKIPRTELAWALANMVGTERYYVRLWRKISMDPGTTVAQALLNIKKDLIKLCPPDSGVDDAVNSCVGSFAKEDFESGTSMLAELIDTLPMNELDDVSRKLLSECARCLREFGFARVEYIVLAFHTMTTVLKNS